LATQIDHIILAVDAAQRLALSQQLQAAGFVHGDAGRHPGGTANENIAFAGGGFIELLYEQSPGTGPPVWFAQTPRVQGIGFSTGAYDRQIRAWGKPPGSWDEMFPKTLDNGADVQCRAAGPLPREEFYVFYMDRAAPPFTGLGATARLTEVTLRSADCLLWRDRFRTWFGLADRNGTLSCAGVKFGFQPGEHSSPRTSLAFAVPGGQATIPIVGGTIELMPTDQHIDTDLRTGGSP
jgi:hypothetical protein